MERYEQGIAAGYLASFLRTFPLDKAVLRFTGEWMEMTGYQLGLEQVEGFAPFLELTERIGPAHALAEPQRFVNDTFLPSLEKHRDRLLRGAPSARERNLRAIGRLMRLDAVNTALLGFFVRYNADSTVEAFADAMCRSHPVKRVIPALLGLHHREFSRRLGPTAALSASGLVKVDQRRNSNQVGGMVGILDQVMAAVEAADGTEADLRSCLLGEPRPATLEWDDFDFLGDVRERLAAFLGMAATERLPGVNILLYGPPGTGKTEFAKTLAARVELSLYAVGETDEEGAEPSRYDRVTALRLYQSLARKQESSVLLFDEMDDAFSPPRSPFGPPSRAIFSKVFTNRLLEENPVPTIWVVNDPSTLDPAIIRRMGFALEMKVPPLAARERVWGRILTHHGVELHAGEVREMARHEGVAPAVVESAVRFARLTGGGADDIREAAQSIVRAMNGRGSRAPEPPGLPFQPALANPDLDLARLAARLAAPGAGRAFSLCLYGPPGTGKSAFARHLAGSLGMEVELRRASDLLDKYVGGTEANIARAFAAAREEGRFLVFDEADSFLGDRSRAQRSWEVSQVNEMLTQMESHPLPFACTTNLMEILDQASLRRFTFKVRFDFLRPEQVEPAFRWFFGVGAPASILSLRCLTPGDFAVARKKAEVLGVLGDPEKLGELLAQEVGVKRERPRAIGFAG